MHNMHNMHSMHHTVTPRFPSPYSNRACWMASRVSGIHSSYQAVRVNNGNDGPKRSEEDMRVGEAVQSMPHITTHAEYKIDVYYLF